MQSVRRILVAIKDPEARKSPAINKAAQLARAFHADVELFHAIAAPINPGFADLNGQREIERSTEAKLKSRLDAMAAPLRKDGLTVTTATRWDRPAGEAIVRRAVEVRADLIVAACHAGSHKGAFLLRATDWDLLRYSPVPVLLVRNARPYQRPVILAAVDPAHAFAKPAKLDSEILETADAFKKALRGTLHALHAYVPLPADASNADLLDTRATRLIEARARAHARDRLVRLLGKVSVAPSNRHLVAEHPVDAIPKVSREIGCHILAMGAVSRSGLKRLFIGNTAERVLDDVSCDVLVVKPPGFQSRIRRGTRGARIAPPPLQPIF